MILKRLIIASMLAASFFGVQAQNKPLPLDPAVRTGKLPNGFTYYIRHNEEPRNRVLMYLVNKVGSVLEDEHQRGLAHFMEHMNFNGTKNFPKNELVDYLQKAGVTFGADINAYTSFDETVYQLPLPSDKPEILHKGLQIMRDWAQNATLEPAEIEKERGVVLEEERLGKGAGERMRRKYWPMILNNSRYANRIPIGLDTVLRNFKPASITKFYQDWYRPNLQALVIVGDINVDSLERVVKIKFANLKNPIHAKPRTLYSLPLTGQNQFVAVTDKEMPSTQLELLIKHPDQPLHSAEDYRRIIIQGLFNQMLASRYKELIMQANPPFINGSAGIGKFIGNTSIFDVIVSAKPGELERGFKAAWREVERLKRYGFTDTELARAKKSYLNSTESALKEKGKTGSYSYVKEYQDYFLKGTAAPGIEVEYELTKHNLPGITLADLNSLAARYITTINRDILILAPDKEKANLPTEASVNGWIKEIALENFQPYADEVSTQQLLTANPVLGSIKSRKIDSKLGITTLMLSNGVKVLLKPTTFKNDEIQFSGFASGGTSLASDANFQSASWADNIIEAGGVGNFNRTQLGKYLQGKQVNVSPFITERFQGISGAATPKDLEVAMQLVYAYFTQPKKDSVVFKGIIERSRARLINRSDDPKSVFNDTVTAVLSNYNSRKTGPSLQKLSQVDLDRAYSFYKQRFADAANFTFTFIGNIDTVSIKPLLEKYLASLPATHVAEQARDLNVYTPEGKIEKTVYRGAEPQSSVILVFSGNFNYTPASKVQLDALRECLQIRLIERLREDEGGVYSPGVFANYSKYPRSRYSFVIQFGCAPQNVDKLVASALDEVNKLKLRGPLQKNLDKWRAETKVSREPQLKSNDFWLEYITDQLQNQDDLMELYNYNALLDEVKPTDLKSAAEKFLSGNDLIRLILKPEDLSGK